MEAEIYPSIKIPKASPPTLVGDSDTTVYSVTSGRVFHLEAVVITNTGSSSVTITFYDGASSNDVKPIPPIIVGNGETKVIDKNVFGGKPKFSTSVVCVADTADVAYVQVLGYEA